VLCVIFKSWLGNHYYNFSKGYYYIILFIYGFLFWVVLRSVSVLIKMTHKYVIISNPL